MIVQLVVYFPPFSLALPEVDDKPVELLLLGAADEEETGAAWAGGNADSFPPFSSRSINTDRFFFKLSNDTGIWQEKEMFKWKYTS